VAKSKCATIQIELAHFRPWVSIPKCNASNVYRST